MSKWEHEVKADRESGKKQEKERQEKSKRGKEE